MTRCYGPSPASTPHCSVPDPGTGNGGRAARSRDTGAALPRRSRHPTPPPPYRSAAHPRTGALPDPVRTVLTQALEAIGRVDEATVQVMRERRPRT
ncbi:hypothetical protein GCM10010284_68310 [Streptomyces rubiginosohelvolus]|uniref:Uncharacterized protein n=1 Tax=Streptomyces rubiginosohelvolus TaxID=67362 RepID=A0ABQ3BIM4_9ACTN|nr:hypothetical protein GCM10010284_68310 [Streptomyces rubiginosohelvolus]GGZ45872.1 hypothetical protein GCM10010328_20580 [Streptomyces pluricolorescens]